MLLYGVGFYKRESATNEINGAWIVDLVDDGCWIGGGAVLLSRGAHKKLDRPHEWPRAFLWFFIFHPQPLPMHLYQLSISGEEL
jgi:hypothetical protein